MKFWAGVMIAAGTLEGVIVGFAQWLVLRRRLRRMSRLEWITATAVGAFAAWVLGMAPSTLMTLNQSPVSSPPPEISDAVKYALAAVMGAALGLILGAPQWRVLRRYASGASLWMWANAAAWAVGRRLHKFALRLRLYISLDGSHSDHRSFHLTEQVSQLLGMSLSPCA